MESRKIIEIYLEENVDEDKNMIDLHKVEDSEVANDTMVILEFMFNYFEENIEKMIEEKELKNMRKFEKVKDYEEKEFNLPIRKTKNAAGYDFECIEDVEIPVFKPGDKPFLVPTGTKCKMPDDEYLMLVNRSSNPKKKNLVIPNSVGIIDADYYGNSDNDGHIMFAFYNLGNEPVKIEKGYCIGQGIFCKYQTTDDDKAEGIREGGFGSTDK